MIGMTRIFDSPKASRHLWIILGLTLTLSGTRAAKAADMQTAELTPGNLVLREANLPTVLSQSDIALYQRIFKLQDDDRWQEADRAIAQLHDKLLVGTVLAQRYRDSGYRTSYAELLHWLEHYADAPDAKAIYALALARHPKGAPLPPKPSANTVLPAVSDESGIEPRVDDPLFVKQDKKTLLPAAAR